MTLIKCNKDRCSFNVEGFCENKVIIVNNRHCQSFTIKDTFTVKDLISRPTGFHREKRKYKNNQGKIYK